MIIRLDQKYNKLLIAYNVNTRLRVAYFMAVIDHESGLIPKRESLYFKTIDKLRETFYTPFKNKTDSFVRSFLRNSEACANYVYANRGGNGDQKSGDGFKYRGGGLIQNTFFNGYKLMEKLTGIPFTKNPDLILIEANAMICALEFWKANNINRYADLDDLDAVSDAVNIGHQTERVGDSNNYKHRQECLAKWKLILNVK
jgi:putative chitinase